MNGCWETLWEVSFLNKFFYILLTRQEASYSSFLQILLRKSSHASNFCACVNSHAFMQLDIGGNFCVCSDSRIIGSNEIWVWHVLLMGRESRCDKVWGGKSRWGCHSSHMWPSIWSEVIFPSLQLNLLKSEALLLHLLSYKLHEWLSDSGVIKIGNHFRFCSIIVDAIEKLLSLRIVYECLRVGFTV